MGNNKNESLVRRVGEGDFNVDELVWVRQQNGTFSIGSFMVQAKERN